MLSEGAFSAFWPEALHLHKWPPLCSLQPSSPKLREFQFLGTTTPIWRKNAPSLSVSENHGEYYYGKNT